MKGALFGVVATVILFGANPTGQGQAEDTKKVAELMRKKLKHSQKVLEGIAVADYEVISQNADELIQISKALEWNVVKTPRYELHSNEFRRAAENLIQRAGEKNIDGAALAYVDLTLTCVRCHKYVREVRMTRR